MSHGKYHIHGAEMRAMWRLVEGCSIKESCLQNYDSGAIRRAPVIEGQLASCGFLQNHL